MKFTKYILGALLVIGLICAVPALAADVSNPNPQKVVLGTVTGVTGTILTVSTLRSPVTLYTVDDTGARTILMAPHHGRQATSLIAAGDRVTVRGILEGTSIDASFILDQGVFHYHPYHGPVPTVVGTTTSTTSLDLTATTTTDDESTTTIEDATSTDNSNTGSASNTADDISTSTATITDVSS